MYVANSRQANIIAIEAILFYFLTSPAFTNLVHILFYLYYNTNPATLMIITSVMFLKNCVSIAIPCLDLRYFLIYY